MRGRTIQEDVQHGSVGWIWSLSDVNKQSLCVWYCTTVSDYTGRRNKRSTVLDRWHAHIHTPGTRQGTMRVRGFIWHFVCHWGSQGTRMYTHTHTHKHTSIANEWLGGWARAPPYQRKEPSSSQSKMCQLKLKKKLNKHQPLATATDPSTSLKQRVQSRLGRGTRGPAARGRGQGTAPPPPPPELGQGSLTIKHPSTEFTPFN